MPDEPKAGSALVLLREAREKAIARLTEAFAHDRLELDEFERRLTIAHRAQSPSELAPLTADLDPASDEKEKKETALVPAPAAPLAPPLAPESHVRDRGRVVAILGGAQRGGAWTPPRRLRVVTVMGGAVLDFRDASLASGVTEVHVIAFMGGVQIIVPPSLAVEMNGTGILGGFEHTDRAPARPDPDRPLLRIDGVACMGGVQIETRLPGESERDAHRRRRRERKEKRALEKERDVKRLPPRREP